MSKIVTQEDHVKAAIFALERATDALRMSLRYPSHSHDGNALRLIANGDMKWAEVLVKNAGTAPA